MGSDTLDSVDRAGGGVAAVLVEDADRLVAEILAIPAEMRLRELVADRVRAIRRRRVQRGRNPEDRAGGGHAGDLNLLTEEAIDDRRALAFIGEASLDRGQVERRGLDSRARARVATTGGQSNEANQGDETVRANASSDDYPMRHPPIVSDGSVARLPYSIRGTR